MELEYIKIHVCWKTLYELYRGFSMRVYIDLW